MSSSGTRGPGAQALDRDGPWTRFEAPGISRGIAVVAGAEFVEVISVVTAV